MEKISDIIEREFTDFPSITTRQFVKVFEDLIIKLPELSGPELKVVLYLGYHMPFKKARIILDSEFWENVKRDTEFSKEYFKKIMRTLRNKQMLYFDKNYVYLSSRYVSRRR